MSELDDIVEFYCKRQNNGYLELIKQDNISPKCKEQCIECACDVGDKRIQTKKLTP